MNFGELRAAVVQAYQEKRYQDALAVISQEMGNFPEQQIRLTNWQAALYEAVGQPEEALAVMAGYVAGGGWYSERMLMDEDFQATRALPGFANLLATCRERQAAAQAETQPELQVRCTTAEGAGAPVLVALHGNPGDIAQSEPGWAPAVALGCVVGLAQSSQIEAPGLFVWNDWGKAEPEVAAHFAQLAAHPAADPQRMVLGGFSTGGGLAAYLALKGAAPVRGFVAVGPYIPDMDQFQAALVGAWERGVRGFILCGDQDRVSLDHAQRIQDLMRQHDLPVAVELVEGLGHDYPADIQERLARGLAFVLTDGE